MEPFPLLSRKALQALTPPFTKTSYQSTIIVVVDRILKWPQDFPLISRAVNMNFTSVIRLLYKRKEREIVWMFLMKSEEPEFSLAGSNIGNQILGL